MNTKKSNGVSSLSQYRLYNTISMLGIAGIDYSNYSTLVTKNYSPLRDRIPDAILEKSVVEDDEGDEGRMPAIPNLMGLVCSRTGLPLGDGSCNEGTVGDKVVVER